MLNKDNYVKAVSNSNVFFPINKVNISGRKINTVKSGRLYYGINGRGSLVSDEKSNKFVDFLNDILSFIACVHNLTFDAKKEPFFDYNLNQLCFADCISFGDYYFIENDGNTSVQFIFNNLNLKVYYFFESDGSSEIIVELRKNRKIERILFNGDINYVFSHIISNLDIFEELKLRYGFSGVISSEDDITRLQSLLRLLYIENY